jgi:hypothetical protein
MNEDNMPNDDIDTHVANCGACADGRPCDEATEILGEIVDPACDLVILEDEDAWPFSPVSAELGGES